MKPPTSYDKIHLIQHCGALSGAYQVADDLELGIVQVQLENPTTNGGFWLQLVVPPISYGFPMAFLGFPMVFHKLGSGDPVVMSK